MSAVPESAIASFRPMRDEDLPAVMKTETAAYLHPWTEGIFRDCLRAGYNCWVIERDGRLLGHAVMSVAVGESHILNVCVHPDEQGQGLGRRLVLHLLKLARGYGAKMALLEVRPTNTAAVALYESLDFSEVGRRPNYYPGHGHGHSDREEAIVMALGIEEEPPVS